MFQFLFFLTLSRMPFISISNPQYDIKRFFTIIVLSYVSKFSAFPNLYTSFHSIKDVLPNFIIVNIVTNERLIIFGYYLHYYCYCILNCLFENKISLFPLTVWWILHHPIQYIKNCWVRLLSSYNIIYICTIYTRLDTCLMSISGFSLPDKVTLQLLKLYFYCGCGRVV